MMARRVDWSSLLPIVATVTRLLAQHQSSQPKGHAHADPSFLVDDID
jgi:hypothetical protein